MNSFHPVWATSRQGFIHNRRQRVFEINCSPYLWRQVSEDMFSTTTSNSSASTLSNQGLVLESLYITYSHISFPQDFSDGSSLGGQGGTQHLNKEGCCSRGSWPISCSSPKSPFHVPLGKVSPYILCSLSCLLSAHLSSLPKRTVWEEVGVPFAFHFPL